MAAMRKEAVARIIRPEFGSNQSRLAEKLVHVDFSPGPNRGIIARNEITGISGSGPMPSPELVIAEKSTSNIIDFPTLSKPEMPPIDEVKKQEVYNPGKRSKQYVDKKGRHIIRRRRASRCNGSHDPESDPCGSPRCRTKGKAKINAQKSGEVRNKNIVRSRGRKDRVLVVGK